MLVTTELTFRILEEIGGEGLNSKAFLAYDPQLDAEVVVKRIKKSDFNDPKEYFNEARILYHTEHPNVMPVKYACQEEDYIYLSMPYCKNGSLNALMNTKFLTVREIIKYSLDFLGGLHFVHTKNLIHFDVKPTNIIIDNSNRGILTDFGLSKYADILGFANCEKVYPSHWVPDAFKSDKLTSLYDVYQVGLTMYRMCNGNNNFHAQARQVKDNAYIVNGTFPNRNDFLPHIPRKMRKCIKSALDVNPDERYQSVMDIMNDISGIDENLDVQYTKDNDKEVWSLDKGKTIKSILLLSDTSNQYRIEGYSYSKSNQRTTRIRAFFNSSLNKNQAYIHIEQFIKEL